MTKAKAKPKPTSLEEAEAYQRDIKAAIATHPVGQVPLGLLKERRTANLAVSRYRGEFLRLNERAILKSAPWRRIEKALMEALDPFPEAGKAVAAALKVLDAREDT